MKINKTNDYLVNIGDVVLYEETINGFTIVDGYKLSKKTLKRGLIVKKIPSIGNQSPKFIINDNEEIEINSIIEVIK